jgi:hypothetical protein
MAIGGLLGAVSANPGWVTGFEGAAVVRRGGVVGMGAPRGIRWNSPPKIERGMGYATAEFPHRLKFLPAGNDGPDTHL